MSRIPLGKVAFLDRGTYSSTAEYAMFDFITTSDSTYYSKQDNNTGHPITDKEWWGCLAYGGGATEAAKKATEAAQNANNKAQAADTAAGKVNEAITGANNAKQSAEEAAGLASSAAQAANEKATLVQENIDELEELEETITAQVRQQPTSMSLTYPKRITFGNGEPQYIKAKLAPAGTGNNVIFLGDNGAVSVLPDGSIRPKAVGKSVIHVIPTENTAIYQTIEIDVTTPPIRLATAATMRLTSSGAMRLG